MYLLLLKFHINYNEVPQPKPVVEVATKPSPPKVSVTFFFFTFSNIKNYSIIQTWRAEFIYVTAAQETIVTGFDNFCCFKIL
jgi:hypothetical protein